MQADLLEQRAANNAFHSSGFVVRYRERIVSSAKVVYHILKNVAVRQVTRARLLLWYAFRGNASFFFAYEALLCM